MKREFNIPDLSDLKTRSISFLINRIFLRAGPKEYKAYALVVNFIRLVDNAVTEYKLGRKSLLLYGRASLSLGMNHYLDAGSHFEISIDKTHRAIKHLQKLKGLKDPSLQPFRSLIPKQMPILSTSATKQVRDMRDAIQHLYEDIVSGKIIQGQSLMLDPKQEQLELGQFHILYSDLAMWLRNLHELSSDLAKFREKQTQ